MAKKTGRRYLGFGVLYVSRLQEMCYGILPAIFCFALDFRQEYYIFVI